MVLMEVACLPEIVHVREAVATSTKRLGGGSVVGVGGVWGRVWGSTKPRPVTASASCAGPRRAYGNALCEVLNKVSSIGTPRGALGVSTSGTRSGFAAHVHGWTRG